MHFLGIDLAFSSHNPSGLYVLDQSGAFVQSDYLYSDQDIVDFVAQQAHPAGNVIVVDAPLVCVNATGQRPCETLVGQLYGRFHASCHSSNTRNRAGQRGSGLVAMLTDKCPIAVQQDARQASGNLWPVIETYPHPAHIEMFRLQRIIKYKKGPIANKRVELVRYTGLLRGLANQEPALQTRTIPLFASNIAQLKGSAYKQHEDLLDALFCAYTALYLWHHRHNKARWHVIAQSDSPDFITIPLP